MNKKVSFTLDTDDYLYLKVAYDEYLKTTDNKKPYGFGKFIWNHLMDGFVNMDEYLDEKNIVIEERLEEFLEEYPELKKDKEFCNQYLK